MTVGLSTVYIGQERPQAYELVDFAIMAGFGLLMVIFSIFICFLIIFRYNVRMVIKL